MAGTISKMTRLRVREVATKLGYNMSTLSRKSDVPFSTIRRAWKDDRYQIQLDTLSKIAKTLGVPTSELIEDIPDDEDE